MDTESTVVATRPRRVAYVGNFEPFHSTENELVKAMAHHGHKVGRLQENRLTDFEQTWESIATFDPDLLLFTRTWGLPFGNGRGNELWDRCREAGIKTASYHLDLYFGLQREAGMAGDPFWTTDVCFTPDGGHEEEFAAAGINHYYLHPAVSYWECERGEYREDMAADVAFFGSYKNYHHAEYPYRRQLVEWLFDTYGSRFRLWSGDSTRNVRGKELQDAVASAKVIIGDSLCLNLTHPYYWSDRIYEMVGRGGFVIHPEIKGLEGDFEHGQHCLFYEYGSFSQLQRMIDDWVPGDVDRAEVSEAGRLHVKEHHTYNNRIEEAFNYIWRDQ